MRCVWTGTIEFGTAAIPVKAYSATEDHSVSLHQLHRTDGGRVRQLRVCEIDGAEVPTDEIVKGYQIAGGDVVMLTEDDFASLPLSTSHAIGISAFVPLAQIDPVYFAKSYYLEPEPSGTKPYVLISEALQQSGLVAVVRVALRQRETLGVLRVRDQVILLETMRWPDEVRTPDFPFLHEDVDMGLVELRAAVAQIERLAGNFVPDEYTDEYRRALQELITAKIEDAMVIQPTAAAQDAGAADLLHALHSSLTVPEQSQRSDENDDEPVRRRAVRKAKAAAQKAADAKKAAAEAADKARKGTVTRR